MTEAAARLTNGAGDKSFLADMIGPELITAASDDGPSGIATYCQDGAQFRFGLTWILLLTHPLMSAIQLISVHIGRTTRRGLAANMALLTPLVMRTRLMRQFAL